MPEFGPVLTYKLLGMVFITFFSILLFSNIVTSLSTFFLSRELDRLVAAPIALRHLFYARFAETMIDSSWMMLVFALPAFLAYGVVHATGPAFYLVDRAHAAAVSGHPGGARHLHHDACWSTSSRPGARRDILVLLSVVAVALLYLLFRLIRPERLVNPEGFADFSAFLAAMRTPEWTFLPSTWAAEILFPLLGLRDGSPLFYYALLATTAAVAVMASEAVVERLFLRGWTKAQEGRQARFTQRALWERALAALTAVFPLQTRVIVVKEVKTFFRDTSQWSQLILLGALVVVYVYNFSVLPLQRQPAGDVLLQERHRLPQPRPGGVRPRLGRGALRLPVVQHGGPRAVAHEGRAAGRAAHLVGEVLGRRSCRCWSSASCWSWPPTPTCRSCRS